MDDVHLVEYDPAWPGLYAAEAALLRHILPPGLVIAIEHFGSTAIPGMAAKPIIDLLVALASIDEARVAAVKPMEQQGYAFWADNPRRDRLFFVKGLPPASPQRTHHVHMTQLDGDLWHRLLFRDYLRADRDEARRYAVLKQDLAARYSHDREAYTAAKSSYVDAVMGEANASRGTW